MRAKLIKREEIARQIYLFEFDSLGEIVNFEPGQFFNLTLVNPPYSDVRGNSRYFGFTNLPGHTTIQMITKTGVSAFKKSLMEMPIGTLVEIDKIQGLPNLPKDPTVPVVFICGGIGIAPVISILRFIKTKNLSYNITLIYVLENTESAPFLEELKSYAKENPNFKLIEATGLDDPLVSKNIQNPSNNLYIVKGEKEFVIPAIKTLKDLGIEASKISMEIFTGY